MRRLLLPLLLICLTACGGTPEPGPGPSPGPNPGPVTPSPPGSNNFSQYSGTLTIQIVADTSLFTQENFVYDFDLATGQATPLFEGFTATLEVSGANPFRAKSGETVYTNATPDLVVANPDGTNNFFVEGSFIDTKIFGSLSDDGLKLLYGRYFQDGFGFYKHVEVVDRDKNLLAEYESMISPTWTRDGRIIMTPDTTFSDLRGLYITDTNLENPVNMNPSLSNPDTPSVSPDGSKVAFTMNGHIWTMGLDGADLKQITSSGVALYYPEWSPDGSLMAAVDQRGLITIFPADPAEATYIDDEAFLYYIPEGKTYKEYFGTTGNFSWR